MLAKNNNKMLVSNGKLLQITDFLVLTLEVSGTSFPDRVSGSSIFSLSSSIAGNDITVDFSDGTGLHTYAPNSGSSGHSYGSTSPLHYFQDVPVEVRNTVNSNYTTRRFVKIKFKYPSAVTGFTFQNMGVYGDFPLILGLFNLTAQLRVSNGGAGSARWESFPVNLKGISTRELYWNSPFKEKLTYFPEFLANSRIENLYILNTFDWSADFTITGVNAISGIVGLINLVIGSNNMGNNSFPTTLKNISTLKSLGIANPFTIFPTAVAECGQIETLTVSREDGNGYADKVTSWGVGLGLMVNLKAVYYNYTQLLTTDLPLGLSNCVFLKTITFHASFITQSRIDAHINNWYDFIVANASTTSGNTKFRNMNIQCGNTIANYNPRPSGGATPTAVVTPPTTPLQKVYNLCKLYGHTWQIRDIAGTGTETITPTS